MNMSTPLNNVTPLRHVTRDPRPCDRPRPCDGPRPRSSNPPARRPHPSEAVNVDNLRDLRALVACACWIVEQGYTVLSATVAHGTLVLRGENHGVEIRRPLRGAAITVAWRRGMERRLDAANIGRQPGAHGPVYIWQAEHLGVRIYWTTEEVPACA